MTAKTWVKWSSRYIRVGLGYLFLSSDPLKNGLGRAKGLVLTQHEAQIKLMSLPMVDIV